MCLQVVPKLIQDDLFNQERSALSQYLDVNFVHILLDNMASLEAEWRKRSLNFNNIKNKDYVNP